MRPAPAVSDLLVRNVTLPDGRQGMDLLALGGRIVAIGPELAAPDGVPVVEGDGQLLAPPFVDAHFHMDATLSVGLPRVNESGTLLEGIALWGELKPLLTQDALVERALQYCDWAVAKGLLAIRSHVDVCDDRLLAVEALLHVRERVKPYLDLQLVAFPQDGLLRSPNALANLRRALDRGVDVIGGIPHFERTMADGAASVRTLCELAAERSLRVDMHCDESDDPLSRHVETLAFETQRLGLHGRVTGSHLTSMHSMDNYYVSKLLPLMREAVATPGALPDLSPLFRDWGIYIFEDGRWKRFSIFSNPELGDSCGVTHWRVAPHPTEDKFFVGSFTAGLIARA